MVWHDCPSPRCAVQINSILEFNNPIKIIAGAPDAAGAGAPCSASTRMTQNEFYGFTNGEAEGEPLMPWFHFHLRTPTGLERDDTGLEFASVEAAYLEVWHTIPEISADLARTKADLGQYVFEITDASGRLLMEVPFAERLRSGQRPRRPKRARRPRPRTASSERRAAVGTVYHLRCSYRFTDGRQGLAVGTNEVKARNLDAAILAAQKICLDRPHMQLASAFLISPEGLIVWSKRVLHEPVRWADATRGIPRFAQG
jgi:hypothetical protein